MRILPCGHIFGRECIIAMPKAATGANCPVCFTPLFFPSPEQLSVRYESQIQEVTIVISRAVLLGIVYFGVLGLIKVLKMIVNLLY